MKRMDQLNDWEELLVVIGARLAWYNRYICQYDVRGLYSLVVDLHMSKSALDELREYESNLGVVKDVLVGGEENCYYEDVLDYGFVKRNGSIEEYPSVVTRFQLREKEGIGYRVSFDDRKQLASTMVGRRYLEVLN